MFSCRSVDSLVRLNVIGEGTYGTVYRARDKDTQEIVALKKLRLPEKPSGGFPITSIREIKILKSIRHENIVNLKEVVVGHHSDHMYLVFEFCEHDLAELLDFIHPFSESEIKCLMLQLLKALAFLHKDFIIHRDLKLSNLLMTNQGLLKLADFGLSRMFQHPLGNLTPKVFTLWYRAPELILGLDSYDTSTDMWSVGCIFGELLKHSPLLPGSTDIEQLDLICKLLGTPNERIWPSLKDMPLFSSISMPNYSYSSFLNEFPNLSDAGIDLLSSLLCYDPAKRLTAEQALHHPYFQESPLPKSSSLMPTFPSRSNAVSRKKRTQAPLPLHQTTTFEKPRKIEHSGFGSLPNDWFK